MIKDKLKIKDKNGFTLAEVLIASVILIFGICGILLTYIHMFILSDLLRDLTLATNAVQAKMEEIKKTNFDNLFTSCPSPHPVNSFCHGDTFDLTNIAESKGRIEIYSDTGYSDLTQVRIVSSLKSRGRLIGEDQNLNGALDTGEDANGNSRLDSPIELVTLIAK